MIKCNFGMVVFDSIVRKGGKELSEYKALPEQSKIEIIAKFWANLVKFVLLNKLNYNYWREPEAKERDLNKKFFSDFPNSIVLKGKKQNDQACLALTVSYNDALSAIEINPYVVAKDKATEEHLLDKVSQQLILVEKFLARNLTKELAIKFCYETLYSQDLCSVRGDEAVTMYKIMMRAIKHYPDFAAINDDMKREVLSKGFYRARCVSARERDVYTFARATFESLESFGLTSVVYKFDPNLNKYKTYERCGQSPNYLPHSNCPRFISYKFGTSSGVEIGTSFLPFDLWELLAKPEAANAPA